MTKSMNFPHKKYARRIGAISRLEKRLEELDTNTQQRDIRRISLEISVLEQRTKSGGGRKSTKKVHVNTGRKVW